MSNIGERLKKVFEKENLTLREASELSSIPYNSLQKYASGIQAPGSEALIKLKNQFNIDLNWLLDGDGETPTGLNNQAILDVDLELKDQVIKSLKKSMSPLFKGPLSTVAINVFSTIYNQVCHIKDSDERALSIHKSIGLQLASFDKSTIELLEEELQKPSLSNQERKSAEDAIALFSGGLSKTKDKFALNTEEVGSKNVRTVEQNISGSSHQIAGRDLVNKDKS